MSEENRGGGADMSRPGDGEGCLDFGAEEGREPGGVSCGDGIGWIGGIYQVWSSISKRCMRGMRGAMMVVVML